MYSSVKIVNLRVKKVSNHGLAALGQRKKDRVRHSFMFPYMKKNTQGSAPTLKMIVLPMFSRLRQITRIGLDSQIPKGLGATNENPE